MGDLDNILDKIGNILNQDYYGLCIETHKERCNDILIEINKHLDNLIFIEIKKDFVEFMKKKGYTE